MSRKFRGPGKHNVAKIKVTCLQCSNVVERYPSLAKDAKFCSMSCRSRYFQVLNARRGANNNFWSGGKANFTCTQCGKEFQDYTRKDGRKDRLFCSQRCRADSKKRRITIVCKICGRSVERIASQDGPYCSQKCFSKDSQSFKRSSGENHWNWKGGVTPKNHAERTSAKLIRWRKSVFERDGYKCAVCEKDRPRLHAHHILEFADYPDRRFDVDNGVTLCTWHHQMLHPKIVLADFRKHFIDGHDNSIGGVMASMVLELGS